MNNSKLGKIFLFHFFAILLLSTQIFADSTATNNSITTRLENGLEVVMLENHSVPLISVFVAIKAGAARETYAQNGLTHFLEHMLFNGTSKFTQKELYDEMDLIGGYNNAFTRKDFTVFTITTPSKFIDRGMELQSGMLFDSTFPPEKVQKEIGIVSEEIRRDYSSPDQLVEDNFDAWVFKGTPYEKTIIGSVPVVSKFTAEDVVNYWKTYYSPNNMTLIVMGDFKPSEMYTLLNKYYGNAQSADLANQAGKHLDPITRNERKLDYIPGISPTVRLVFNAPEPMDKQYQAFQVFTGILGDEINAYLQNLNPSDPMQASVSTTDCPSGSRMIISIQVPESSTVAKAESDLLSALMESSKKSTDKEKLEATKITAYASEIKLLENTMMFGMMTVGEAAMWGWDWASSKTDRIEKITLQDIDSFRNEYASPVCQTYIAMPFPEDSKSTAQSKAVFIQEILGNGLTVAIQQDNSSEIFGMHLLVKNRCYLEPKGKDGIADLLHRTLLAGTSKHPAAETEHRIAMLGADVKTNDWGFVPFDDYYLDAEYSYVRFTGLDKFWKENIDLLNDLLLDDSITQESLDASMQGLLQELGPQMGMPGSIASTAFKNKIRAGSPLARPIMGSMMSMGMMKLDDVVNFRKTYFSPSNLILTIVTSEDAKSVMDHVKSTLGNLPKVEVNPEIPVTRFTSYPGEEFVTEKGVKQAEIIWAFAVNDVDDADIIPLSILGGIISDQAAFDLRETQGLAYSIGASFGFYGNNGYFALRMGTGPDNIEKAKTGIINVMNGFKTVEFTQKELELSVNSRTAGMIRYRVKRENQAYFTGYDIFKGKDPQRDPVADWSKVTLDDLYRVRDKYLKPENGFWVIVK
jgi:zinc protease